MRIDAHAWVGDYPYRALERTDVDALLREMDALAIDRAWVGSLPAAFRRDPARDTLALYAVLAPHRDRLAPAPAIRPDLPSWEAELGEAAERGSPVVRVYPPQWGLPAAGEAMRALASAAAAAGLGVALTVRFEDQRQRQPPDLAPELEPADVRALIRAAPAVRLLVGAAGRAFVEEVHWGSAADEAARLWWDVSHLWGPPEDDLEHLVRIMGAERFVLGTHWPLRIGEAALAKLDLLEVPPLDRARIEAENALALAAAGRAGE